MNAAEYYTEHLGVSPAFAQLAVQPRLIFGLDGDRPQGVRQLESKSFRELLNRRLQEYCWPWNEVVAERADVPVGYDKTTPTGYPPIEKLTSRLVPKKIVTGAIQDITIAAVEPGALAPNTRNNLRKVMSSSRPVEKLIPDLEVYFRILATLKMGGRLATAACAARVDPILRDTAARERERLVFNGSPYPKGKLGFHAVVAELHGVGTSAREWELSKVTAGLRKAASINKATNISADSP